MLLCNLNLRSACSPSSVKPNAKSTLVQISGDRDENNQKNSQNTEKKIWKMVGLAVAD